MSQFLLASLWAVCVVLSFIGWGTALERILFAGRRVDWGQRAAWGMAFAVLVGGALNVTESISRTSIGIFVTLGVLVWMAGFFGSGFSKTSWHERFFGPRKIGAATACLIVLLGVVVLEFAGNVFSYDFFELDDYHAYLVFPEKMLQTGSLGNDPFNERRLSSALGGQSYLQAMILCGSGWTHLRMLDPGIALVIVLGCLWSYLREKKLSTGKSVFLIALFLLLPKPEFNVSSNLTASALFLSLFKIFDWEGLRPASPLPNAFMIALLASALCTLKSTWIAVVFIFFVCSYLFYFWGTRENRRSCLREFMTSSSLTVAFLLPWMISEYESSGTFLYPILGKGFHCSNYGDSSYYHGAFFPALVTILKATVMRLYLVSVAALGALCFIIRPRKVMGREALFSFVIACLVGTPILAVAVGGGAGFERYPIPYINIAIVLLMAWFLSEQRILDGSHTWVSRSMPVVFLIAGLLVGGEGLFYRIKGKYDVLIGNILDGIGGRRFVTDQQLAHYRRMQASVPPREKIMARLDRPFLLDFKRNPVLVPDWPGASSPPPGMPLSEGPEALAHYLILQSIRYVAYSYKNEAGFHKATYGKVANQDELVWPRNNTRNAFLFQDCLQELGRSRVRIYDDGEIFVIDLMSAHFLEKGIE